MRLHAGAALSGTCGINLGVIGRILMATLAVSALFSVGHSSSATLSDYAFTQADKILQPAIGFHMTSSAKNGDVVWMIFESVFVPVMPLGIWRSATATRTYIKKPVLGASPSSSDACFVAFPVRIIRTMFRATP
jgi:hypothetical protein